MLPRIRTLIDDVFVRLVLGVADERRRLALTAAIRRMLWTPGNPPMTIPGEGDGLFGAAGTALFERRRAPLAALLREEIERRRGSTGDAVLDLVARGHEPADALVDELLPLLMAAQEPPAIAVAWVLDRLGREPDPAAGLLDGSADDAFVRETLRLRPPAMAALRRLTEPREVAGHRLPAGVTVMMPTVPLHRDPAAFLDADAFRPERWTHDSPAFLPFGGGERRCLGEHLAHAYFGGLLPALAGRTRPVRPEPERMVLRDRAGPAPQRARQSRETSLKNVLSSPLAFSSW